MEIGEKLRRNLQIYKILKKDLILTFLWINSFIFFSSSQEPRSLFKTDSAGVASAERQPLATWSLELRKLAMVMSTKPAWTVLMASRESAPAQSVA